MRTMMWVGLLLLSSLVVSAADKIHPLNVKTGLWEVTTLGGVTGAPPKPPGMTAEQHAKFLELWKKRSTRGSKPITRTNCITKEKLNKTPFADDQQSCNPTVLSSTSSKLEMNLNCEMGDLKRTGTFELVAHDPEHVTGTTHMEITRNGSTMKVNSNFTAKWVSPSCPAKR